MLIAFLRVRLWAIEREGWDAAYREGRTLPSGEVAALALRLLDEVAQAPAGPGSLRGPDHAAQPLVSPPSPPAAPHPLSAREQEVLRLVAQGCSNRAIGRALFISDRTAGQYLTAMFNKLGVNTRAQAVAVASQRGLL